MLLDKEYQVRALAQYNSFNKLGWLEKIPSNDNSEILSVEIRDPQSYEKLSVLLPYYDSLKFLNQLIEPRSTYEKFKLLSKIYPFNSNLISIIKNSIFEKSMNASYNDGFAPINRFMAPTKTIVENSISNIIADKIKVDALDSIIS